MKRHITVLLATLLIACGGETPTDEPTTPPAEGAEATEQVAQPRNAPVPTATEAAPTREEGPRPAFAPPVGQPLPVYAETVTELPVSANVPSHLNRPTLRAEGDGIIAVTGLLSGTCGANPAFMAYRETGGDASIVRLTSLNDGPTARCPAHYRVDLRIAVSDAGTFSFAIGDAQPYGEVTIGAAPQAAELPGAPQYASTQQLVVDGLLAEPTLAHDAETGRTALRFHFPARCTEADRPFRVTQEGTKLILQQHRSTAVARCAATPQTYEVIVWTAGTAPTEFEFRDSVAGEVINL